MSFQKETVRKPRIIVTKVKVIAFRPIKFMIPLILVLPAAVYGMSSAEALAENETIWEAMILGGDVLALTFSVFMAILFIFTAVVLSKILIQKLIFSNRGAPEESPTEHFSIFDLTAEEILDENGPWNYGFLAAHSKRITMIGERIAETLNLAEEQIELLKYALMLHEVGGGIKGKYNDEFNVLAKSLTEAVAEKGEKISVKKAMRELIFRQTKAAALKGDSSDNKSQFER